MKKLLVAIGCGIVYAGSALGAVKCRIEQIDIGTDTDNCKTVHFSIGTTNISANGTFTFNMSAQGTFYVDCGNGGTLSGTGVSGKTITRSNTNDVRYTCTYSKSGTKIIRFGGVATGYNEDVVYAPISFNGNGLVSSVDGNMSTMFPYLGAGAGQAPRFYRMFAECTNLTSISGSLFDNYTVGVGSMFDNAFYGCTGLTELPAGLFRNITSAGGGTFAHTFENCTNLSGYIPRDLFAGLIANGSPGANDSVMVDTFKGDRGLARECPAGTTEVETPYSQYWDGKPACLVPRSGGLIVTSRTYVQTQISGLQDKFEGLGANKLMTFGTQAGQVSNRDIVTTLGTPNASGIYSNTSDTSVPTIGAINSAVIAKQDLLNGTTGFAIAGTGTPGELSEKPIYSLQVGPDSLIEAGTLNTAVVDAVNSEMTQINENGEADPNGTLWRINDIVTLLATSDTSSAPDLMSLIGNTEGVGYATTSSTGTNYNGNPALYGISGISAFAVDYGVNGYITGFARCSTTGGQDGVTTATTLTADIVDEFESGACWCMLDSYTPDDGIKQSFTTPWLLFSNEHTDCLDYCADTCVFTLMYVEPEALTVRQTLFNSVQ